MTLTFAPFLPWIVIAVLAVAALALSFIGLWRGVRGAWLRGLALVALLAAIANPLLTQEEREPLSTIVPVIVDRSQSQDVQDRPQMTDTALETLKDRLSRFPRIEPRIVEVRDNGESDSPSTQLFSALSSAVSDVSPSRVGGAIFLSDGQIHDIPNALPNAEQALGFRAPVHGLITGKADEFDRRIEIVRAPRFGIVNEEQQLTLRVFDDGRPMRRWFGGSHGKDEWRRNRHLAGHTRPADTLHLQGSARRQQCHGILGRRASRRSDRSKQPCGSSHRRHSPEPAGVAGVRRAACRLNAPGVTC